jgi:hypothetical protein
VLKSDGVTADHNSPAITSAEIYRDTLPIRVCFSILAFADGMADAGWFGRSSATPPRNQRSFLESTILLPEQTASIMVVTEKRFRNQVQVWPETGSVSARLTD